MVKMVATKHCLYPGCHNDSRKYFKDCMKGVFFLPFPKPKTNLSACMRWLQACGKSNPDKVKSHWYVCNVHFVGNNGPTLSHPDPIACSNASKNKNSFIDQVIELGWSFGKDGDCKRFTKTHGGKQLLQLIWQDSGELQIRVLNTASFLSHQHFLWKTLPFTANTDAEVILALQKLSVFKICVGSPDPVLKEVYNSLPQRQHKTGVECYDISESSCIRSVRCSAVVPLGLFRKRCIPCTRFRMYLQITKNNKLKKTSSRVKKKTPQKIKIKKLKEFFGQRAFDEASFNEIFQEQKRRNSLAKNKYGYKWHPDILEWCQFLKSKSTSSYEAFRKFSVMPLPSLETLSKQSKTFAKPGFSTEQFQELKNQMNKLGPEAHHKYVSLVWDEVKMKEKKDYSLKTGEIMDIFPKSKNSDILGKVSVATHMFQIMVRGLTSDFKFSLAFFPSKGIDSSQIIDIIWVCVEKLELIGAKVIAFVCDASSANRDFFHTCSAMESTSFRVLNRYARDEKRYIYLISDVPHLIKTTRDCFSNSGFHSKTKNLWKNGKNISWNYVMNLYKKTRKNSLGIANRLSFSHVFLNPYSKMSLKLAVQVLSNSVATALESEKNPQHSETILFIRMFNKFFDIMNTKNLDEAKAIENPNNAAFTSVDDPRFQWLEGEFLDYLRSWERDVINREGKFTSEETDKMLLGIETREGLFRSVHSVVAIVKFLLEKGASFILTKRLNQDILEREFSLQSGATGSNTNLTFFEYMNKIKNIQAVRPIIKKYQRMRKKSYVLRKQH